jgi:hypothetical protein
MKTFTLIVIILLVSLGLNWLLPGLPWFMPCILAFLAGIVASRLPAAGFLTGFLGVGLFWTALVLASHLRNGGVLTGQIAAILSENMGRHVSSLLLLILTPVLGALLGGLAAWSGKLLFTATDYMNSYSRRRERRKGSYKLKLN